MTETDIEHEDHTVGFDQLEAVEERDRIAVRAVDGTTTILAGTVTDRCSRIRVKKIRGFGGLPKPSRTSVGRIVDVVFGETIWLEEIVPD